MKRSNDYSKQSGSRSSQQSPLYQDLMITALTPVAMACELVCADKFAEAMRVRRMSLIDIIRFVW
jgi:hypothetical protein